LCLVADLLQTRNRLPQILPRDEQMIRRQVHPAPRGRSRELTISTASSRDRVQQLTLGEGGRIPPPQAEGAMLEVCDFIESYLGRDCAACDMLTMARAIHDERVDALSLDRAFITLHPEQTRFRNATSDVSGYQSEAV
jgi:hypothetical protein